MTLYWWQFLAHAARFVYDRDHLWNPMPMFLGNVMPTRAFDWPVNESWMPALCSDERPEPLSQEAQDIINYILRGGAGPFSFSHPAIDKQPSETPDV